jgi:diguanylate cyclase (GGDEF)-like protein
MEFYTIFRLNQVSLFARTGKACFMNKQFQFIFQMKGFCKRCLTHSIVGAIVGYIVLHPISVAIYSRTSPEHFHPLPVGSAFSSEHAWMAAYFTIIGAVFGLIHGLNRYRNAQLFDKVKQLSITDSLTELHNRRFFIQNLSREVERAKRYGSDLSLMMIDIDYFKRFNDTHGHPAGDTLLQVFADRLRLMARKTDIVARYGGEEFVVMMPDTNLAMAANLAERLRKDIESFPFEKCASQPGGKITVSIGCAQFDRQNNKALDQLLQAADDCLYRAKSSGRNQICY